MKPSRILFFLAFLPLTYVFAEDTETSTIDFGGGLNSKSSPQDVADNESPDMSNFISDIYGTLQKRNGTQRYIGQALSSAPITSLYRAYASTGSSFKSVLISVNNQTIYFSSSDASPLWTPISSGYFPNQHWFFQTMANKVIMTPDSLLNKVKQFDIIKSSVTDLFTNDGGTNTVTPRAKYGLATRGYLILANCADADLTAATTFYPSRLYYGRLLDNVFVFNPSSFTQSRYIDIHPDDGEPITGISELNREVHIWKETTITELDFTILNLTSQGGDMTVKTIVQGFGLYAPRTLQSTGDGYIFGSKDGLRFWDGGKKSRLQVEQESRPLSTKIKTLIDKSIKAGTWKNAVGKYYPKKSWYLLSFEDPDMFPHGKNNRVLVFDLITGNWFPFNGWLVDSWESEDGIGDNGQLLYGDSSDGYVYLADNDNFPNDARKEISVSPMDNSAQWVGSGQDTSTVIEGTASLKISIGGGCSTCFESSMTYMAVLNFGDWYDKSNITKNDKLSFSVRPTTVGNISSLRIDLEVYDFAQFAFDTNFTSVTFSSSVIQGSLANGVTDWNRIEVPISSFPIRPDWTDLTTENVPFANNLTFYGIRFVSSGTGNASVNIDDLRVVQGSENPLNAYRYSKQFSFGSSQPKTFRQIILNRELSSDSRFSIDVFTDFGSISKKIPIAGDFPKEVFVAGFGGTNTISKLNSSDFTLKEETRSVTNSVFDYRYLVADKDNIFAVDKLNDRLYKISRSSMSVFVSTYGVFGPGTTNFNTVQQMALDDDNLYLTDVANNRIKIHDKKTLNFVNSYGQLGLGATSYHSPTGIAVDERFIYVADEGNNRIKKVFKSSGTLSLTADLNLNTVGEMTLCVDEKYLYDAYNNIIEQNIQDQDVVLEKRDKEDLKLVNRIVLRPQSNSLLVSTYSLKGSMGITDDYIFVSFTEDANLKGNYYLQKRLKSDFSLVKEFKTTNVMYSIGANGISFKPKRKVEFDDLNAEGSYIQIKYSENDLNNSFKLLNQAFLIIPQGVKEKQ